MLRWYLALPGAICIVAENAEAEVTGFILAEADPPDGYIITLDVALESRRAGLGSELTVAAENASQ